MRIRHHKRCRHSRTTINPSWGNSTSLPVTLVVYAHTPHSLALHFFLSHTHHSYAPLSFFNMALLDPNHRTKDPRISQILPTVKCSTCSQPVPLARLGDPTC